MNIAEFALQPDLEKLVIEEIKPARKLQEETWIQCGAPNTNAWYLAMPNDGEVVRVEEDGEAYAETFALTDCHGTSNTFWYDDLNKVLYVHTTDSDDPATLDGADPKYNITAFFWEFFSNRVKQLQPCENILKELNGGLEFWASATDAEEVTETIAGTSTVNKETTEVDGNHSYASARLDIDAGNDIARIRWTVTLPPRRKARIKVRYLNSASGKTGYLVVADSGTNVYLNSSYEWQAGATGISIPNSESWATFEVEFVTHASYSTYYVYLQNNAAASSSIYFDNIEVWRYRRVVDCHAFLPQGAIPSVCQGVGNYHQPDERLSFGVTKINNVDGWFYSRRYEEGYLWHGKDIRLRVGHKDESYEDLAIFFTGVTRTPVWGNIIEIGVKDERVLLKTIPCEYFDEDNYPAIETEWKGKRIPYLLGPVEDIKPPQIDIENQIFKISQAVFDRVVTYTWYLNEDCVDQSDWVETNVGQGDTSQEIFKGKACFKHNLDVDGAPAPCYTRITRDVGTLPDSFTFEIKLYHAKNFDTVAANKHITIDVWNGSIKLQVRIDLNSIDIYDGAAWGVNASANAEKMWHVYKFVIDGSVPGSETVDIYRNGSLIVAGEDCSNADATNDGQVQITYHGDEIANIIHYTDYIRAYVENVIEAGTTLGIYAIDHVYKTTGAGVKTELTLGADYTVDLNNGEFTVSAALAEGDIITCDARGLKCDFEDSTYAYLPADFLYFLYVTLNGVSKYRLDMASLHDLKTNRLLLCGKWLYAETDSTDFLIEMKKTAIFQTYVRLDGTIVFHRYSSDVASDAPHYYNEDFIGKPTEEEDTSQCFKEVAIKSCYKPYGAYYEYEEVDDTDETEWNYNEKGRLTHATILQTQFQARNLRDNILGMVKIPPSVISLTLTSSALLLNPTDKVYLNYTEKESSGNDVTVYDEEVVRILSLDKDLNTGHVRITAMKDVADFYWIIT